MHAFSDAELIALLDDLESDRVERKQSWSESAAEKGCEAVCAFANDLPNHRKPGVLLVGVNDAGTPVGTPVTDDLLQTLAHIKTSGNMIPPPTIFVEKRVLKGQSVAVVTVLPADAPPVQYKGRIWIRIGPRRGIATSQDERILNEKRRHRDVHFEAHPLRECSLKELNRLSFEQEYLPRAFAPDVLEANDRSYEQRLASCGMIASVDEAVPTVLGILCLGQRPRTWVPGSYVQFLRIRGAALTDGISDEAEVDGTVDAILRRLDEKLKAHQTTAVDFTSAAREIRKTAFPPVALQQIVRNAVLHRTYENTNAPVRVYWFDDRIEVISPGGPYGSINAANFGQPGRTDYRNPQLAAAFKVFGYAQRFGAGISVANKALAENGNPPIEFQIEPNFVAAILRRGSSEHASVAAAATAADSAAAGKSFAGEPDVLGDGEAERVAVRAHGVIGQMLALPWLDRGAGDGEERCGEEQEKARDFHGG